MKFKIFICVLFVNSLLIFGEELNCGKSSLMKYEQQIQALDDAKRTILSDKIMQQREVFTDSKIYSRWASEIALFFVAFKFHKKSDESMQALECFLHNSKSFLSCFCIIVEVVKVYKAYQSYKALIEVMTYEEFVFNYPHLVLVEYQISIFKTLIDLSFLGTFPEKIFARIQLVKMSLPYPYEKQMNKYAKKLFEKSFDKTGKFIWKDDFSVQDHPYLSFDKKIPQDYKGIVFYAYLFSSNIEQEYFSPYVKYVSNAYNDTLIHMVYAGIKKDYDALHTLSQKYKDPLVTRLYRYYVS